MIMLHGTPKQHFLKTEFKNVADIKKKLPSNVAGSYKYYYYSYYKN